MSPALSLLKERDRISNFARLIIAVREARQGESMNVEAVEREYVPGPDGYLR